MATWDIGLKLPSMAKLATLTERVRKGMLGDEAKNTEGVLLAEPTPRIKPLGGRRSDLRGFLVNSSLAAIALQTVHALLPFHRSSWYSPLCAGLAIRLAYEVLMAGVSRERRGGGELLTALKFLPQPAPRSATPFCT